ncbi:phosphatase PAP2 family protein [Paucibacter sp. M5-1]|uniref:phosphatase PAP2 family protein n=1 Tax=Paucibacter sp. M5-1 TaxID=3015998 RepID=UPI0022B91A8B|nr:phosphatase PAP2 family protein [Paucibacter sp. M5-1]MCZ7882288.1 phosphatase PAP2 family protein [Paucibacter sp. M5-1]
MRRGADAWLTLLALAALLLWELLGWDLGLSRLYGGPAGFAWRDAWLTRDLLHEGGRLLGLAGLALLAWQVVHPPADGPGRAERGYWLAVMLACALLVPALKSLSDSSCPWSLAEFGGSVAYVPHWMLGVADGGPGHCFPSGHAVSGFAFFGLYFQWRDNDRRRARRYLAATLLLGTAFGWAQLARGAHFASHSAWSAWLCWTLAVLAARWAPARKNPGTEPPSHALPMR